ncbi:MAG TPA: hypothetical protein VFP20_09360 [Bacteroidales bacterium]|nr:hypothetical protein [Bacteroidales bacterium]
MKKNMKFLLFAVSMLTAIGFTACDENATIDIDGPDIDVSFDYSSLRSKAATEWVVIASDTLPGKNMDEFLAKDTANAAKADAIKSATIRNGILTVNGGNFNFNGVDSVRITYQIVNTTQVFTLVIGAPRGTSKDTIYFSDIKFEKEQAHDLLSQDKVVSMSAIYNPLLVNCFQPGAVYRFKANTRLAVLATAATDLLSGF